MILDNFLLIWEVLIRVIISSFFVFWLTRPFRSFWVIIPLNEISGRIFGIERLICYPIYLRCLATSRCLVVIFIFLVRLISLRLFDSSYSSTFLLQVLIIKNGGRTWINYAWRWELWGGPERERGTATVQIVVVKAHTLPTLRVLVIGWPCRPIFRPSRLNIGVKLINLSLFVWRRSHSCIPIVSTHCRYCRLWVH